MLFVSLYCSFSSWHSSADPATDSGTTSRIDAGTDAEPHASTGAESNSYEPLDTESDCSNDVWTDAKCLHCGGKAMEDVICFFSVG